MESPIHASQNVDKDEMMPRIIAIVAGVALIAIVTGGVVYSGMWSPSNPTQTAATMAKH
ncbi:MAG TPA: hypothetical protein VIJ85_03590 [Rhizomicrobium sp.]|jgi:hypothetical protein